MTARLLVIQHEQDAPAAWLGEWWQAVGLDLDVVRGDLGEPVPDHMTDHDGLVVLGGDMGACDDAVAPWLAPTRSLIADAVAHGIPTLGVCLGHQLTSVALGGSIGRNPSGRTVGLVPVRLTDAGSADPLLAGLGGQPAVHYNDDVVLELPVGASARRPGACSSTPRPRPRCSGPGCGGTPPTVSAPTRRPCSTRSPLPGRGCERPGGRWRSASRPSSRPTRGWMSHPSLPESASLTPE
jgi:GMP synthase-like glutamine amidotransferase